jgi:hypothetical protein
MLFANGREELLNYLPRKRPAYANANLSAYRLLDDLGASEEEDPYHFAPSLIRRIAATPGQSVGSHTFAHYYCLEEGQLVEDFAADLNASRQISQVLGLDRPQALVLPRNQCREEYLPTIKGGGFASFRGNPEQWFWSVRSDKQTSLTQRGVRLLDNYLPVTKQSTLFNRTPEPIAGLYNIRASRFFRPYLPLIDGYGGQRLKVRRILKEMDQAARRGLNYHLWWHPHNLATHPEKNMKALTAIVHHFQNLRQHGWESHSMETYISRLQSKG